MIKKRTFFGIFLCLIIFINLQGFYFNFLSFIPYKDISVIVCVLFTFCTYYLIPSTEKTQYKWLFIFPIFLFLFSSYRATQSYNQPFLLGIQGQRVWIITILMYFPFSRLIKNKIFTTEYVMKLLDYINLIYLSLIVLQSLLHNYLTFLSNTLDSTRIYFILTFSLISLFYHFDKFIRIGKISRIGLFVSILSLISTILVAQSRMGIITLLITLAFMLLLHLKNLKVWGIIIFAGIITLFFLFETRQGTRLLTTIYAFVSGNSQTIGYSATFRNLERTWMNNQTFSNTKNFLFGVGFPNQQWGVTQRVTGFIWGYTYTDIGIQGIMYYYGFISVIWTIILFFKVMKDSWKSNQKFIFFYLFWGIIGLYTLLPPHMQAVGVADVSFPLICSFLSINKMKKN